MKKTNNAQFSNLIKQAHSACIRASSVDELKAVIEQFVNFPHALKFNNGVPNLFLGVSVIAALVLAFFIYVRAMPISPYWFLPFALVGGISFWVIFSRRKQITNISEAIEAKAMRFLYKMTPCASSFYMQYITRFKDFNRGNYSSDLEKAFEFEFDSDPNSELGKKKAYTFTHHYVDEVERTSTDSKGNTTTHTEYEHYYRQGVILPDVGGRFHSMLVSEDVSKSYWSGRFNPASMKFQKRFDVQGHSDLELAKFLEPSVVLLLENVGEALKNLTVEFAADGSLLVNFESKDLLDVKMKYDIRKPELFSTELFNSSYKQLDYLLGFANQLIKQID